MRKFVRTPIKVAITDEIDHQANGPNQAEPAEENIVVDQKGKKVDKGD